MRGIHREDGVTGEPSRSVKGKMLLCLRKKVAPRMRPYGKPITTRIRTLRTRSSGGKGIGETQVPIMGSGERRGAAVTRISHTKGVPI